MKKRLLTPPGTDGEILFLTRDGDPFAAAGAAGKACTAHQPYFFNPGVSVKFLLLERIAPAGGEIVFVDTDRVRLEVRIPAREGWPRRVGLINSDGPLRDCPSPGRAVLEGFFRSLKTAVREAASGDPSECLACIERFEEIVAARAGSPRLRDILAESFLAYHGIGLPHVFLSDVLAGDDYAEFVERVRGGGELFREIFNRAIDEFRGEFRFRFRNYPFPKLREGELPFWIVGEGKRERCFAESLTGGGVNYRDLFPRAGVLTLFLRLHGEGPFIHGIGGGNYEWVADRIIERFFHAAPPPYVVASGTFLLPCLEGRDLPYFFHSPGRIRRAVDLCKITSSGGRG